jgi:sulfoxide reductase heme-binding subunit YedZ
MKRLKKYRLQILTHVGALIPMLRLVWHAVTDNLSVNPIQDVTLRTGKPALVLLVLTLSITPLNTVFGFRQLLRIRRWLGLYAFFYASVHFMIFIGLDYGFDLELLKEAIFEKPYALVGFATGVILLALALTSTKGWMRRLGRWWKRLHKFVYLAGVLAVVHYVWLVKSDIRVPLLYGAIVILLLTIRLPRVRKFASRLRYSQDRLRGVLSSSS